MDITHSIAHQPPGKIQQCNELLKTALRAMGGGIFKHLAKATWLVSTRESVSQAGTAQSQLLHTGESGKFPVVHIKHMLGKKVWVIPASGKSKTNPWDCFCSRTWVHLMSNMEGWGSLVCASRGFDFGWELQLIKLFDVIAI